MNFYLTRPATEPASVNIKHLSSNIDLKSNTDNPQGTKELAITSNMHKREEKRDIAQVIRTKLKYNQEGLCVNAFYTAISPEILKIAYETIKSKPGNMVRGSDTETLDGISWDWICNTSEKLKREVYEFKPSRRVYIPKANGKKRPLGIGSPRDKIVQQALKMVLEIIIEPKFLDTSHGFRPKRGCHSALKYIRNWKGVPWLLEGDIKSFFDSIDHHVLAKLLSKHFRERRLLNIYWKLVKAGYVEWEKGKIRFIDSTVGVPQGGIISPLLSNLILHEFDIYIDSIKRDLDKKNKNIKPQKKNPIYASLTARIRKINASGADKHNPNRPVFWNDKAKIIKLRRKHKSTCPNPIFTRIEYVRYADDWLIGIWGTKKYCNELKNLITNFMNTLKLELSIEKTLITNTRNGKALFLGTFIKRVTNNCGPTKNVIRNNKLQRSSTGNLWLTAPMKRLVDKLKNKGFVKVIGNKWVFKAIKEFLVLPIKDLIIRFRAILMGFTNYYSFADNLPKLKKIHWILWNTLAKTIMRKKDMNWSTFKKKFGKNISLYIRNLKGKVIDLNFKPPTLTRKPTNFKSSEVTKDPLNTKNWRITTINSLRQPCANCGANKKIEMHHVKHIKTLNVKLNTFDRQMASINRKQVPLCTKCHDLVHAGKYSGLSLRHLKPKNWEGEKNKKK